MAKPLVAFRRDINRATLTTKSDNGVKATALHDSTFTPVGQLTNLLSLKMTQTLCCLH